MSVIMTLELSWTNASTLSGGLTSSIADLIYSLSPSITIRDVSLSFFFFAFIVTCKDPFGTVRCVCVCTTCEFQKVYSICVHIWVLALYLVSYHFLSARLGDEYAYSV